MKKSLASLVFIPTEVKGWSEAWFTFIRIQGSLNFHLFSVVSTAWCSGVWHHLKTQHHVWSDLLVIFTTWQVKEFWLLRMVIPQAVPSAAWVSYHSIQFSRSVMSDSLWPHGWQHARLLCPSLTPGTYSNSCPSSRWCHATIFATISVVPFSSHLQSFTASGSFQMSQFFASGGQGIRVSASTSVLPWTVSTDFL